MSLPTSHTFQNLKDEEFLDWIGFRPDLPLTQAKKSFQVQLFHVSQIFEDDARSYRKALANAYAALDPEYPCSLVYLLKGSPEGVSLYFGVAARETTSADNMREARKLLVSALEGQLPGLDLKPFQDEQLDSAALLQQVFEAPRRGLLTGVPHVDEEDEEGFQGVERLVRALLVGDGARSGEHWQLAIITQPLPSATVRQWLDEAMSLASLVHSRQRAQVQVSQSQGRQLGYSEGKNASLSISRNEGTSKQEGKSEGGTTTDGTTSNGSKSSTNHSEAKTFSNQWSTTYSEGKTRSSSEGSSTTESISRNTGSQVSVSAEQVDKRLEWLAKHLEEWLIPRLQKGLARGMFSTQVFLAAPTPSAYRRLVNTVRATFQGQEASLTPLQVHDLPPHQPLDPFQPWALLHKPASERWRPLVHSQMGAMTCLTPDELAILAGLPQRELPGLARLPTADFALSPPRPEHEGVMLRLGAFVDHGRALRDLVLRLPRDDLNKHVFVTGVTGAGKTTTCLKLLLESRLPFLVIEPAKTEYRALYPHQPDTLYFRPLADAHHSFRFNPMALVHRQQKLASHVEFLSSAITAVFPMEASMPFLVKQAIIRAYELRGWDVHESTWFGEGDPFDPKAQAWPTLSEMIGALDAVIREQKMGKEFEEKYRGSLVSRLTDLTRGPLGVILDVRHGLDWQALLDQKVVLELEEVKSPEGKALLMALVLGALAEAVKVRHAKDPAFRHLTLVEEAHRLLAQPEPGAADARRLAVEAFADLLAEVRKYGAGLIVVDQIPAKLIPDVLKNTHTKIVHRIFAADDTRTLGEAMLMNDKQRQFLPKLKTGQAVVYCGGWHMPALVNVDRLPEQGALPDEATLERGAIGQLWAQRGRYYPTLASLPLLAEPEVFARFVKEGRQALTAWLKYLGLEPSSNQSRTSTHPLRVQLLARLKGFVRHWKPIVAAQDAAYAAWRAQQAARLPEEAFSAALLALACDANPLPRVEVEKTASLNIRLESEIWIETFQALLHKLETLEDGADRLDIKSASYLDAAGMLKNYERM